MADPARGSLSVVRNDDTSTPAMGSEGSTCGESGDDRQDAPVVAIPTVMASQSPQLRVPVMPELENNDVKQSSDDGDSTNGAKQQMAERQIWRNSVSNVSTVSGGGDGGGAVSSVSVWRV